MLGLTINFYSHSNLTVGHFHVFLFVCLFFNVEDVGKLLYAGVLETMEM